MLRKFRTIAQHAALAAAFLAVVAHSQTYRVVERIGDFQDATAFEFQNDLFYVADAGADNVFAIDGKGDVVASGDGFGWEPGYFDDPFDVDASTLNVFVADRNNRRVQLFDRKLRYVGERSGDYLADIEFGYLVGCAVSPMGDLYALDAENRRVMKFGFDGEFKDAFGDHRDGAYALVDPVDLETYGNRFVLVIDGERLLAFNPFGGGELVVALPEPALDVRVEFSIAERKEARVLLVAERTLYLADLETPDRNPRLLDLEPIDESFVGALFLGERIAALTPSAIYLYAPD
ncbi:MAG: hypothetical protein GF419_12030 [Ignavibacteriales bacterium]|nr:hypothetical protein [Ignavibacteriales bacterium]